MNSQSVPKATARSSAITATTTRMNSVRTLSTRVLAHHCRLREGTEIVAARGTPPCIIPETGFRACFSLEASAKQGNCLALVEPKASV